MRGKKRIGLMFLLIAVVVGGGGLLLAQKALHKTSDTAFCLSCHSMSKPFEEYQGTVHFSNQKGIRAECADCHIPKSGMDYLFAKEGANKRGNSSRLTQSFHFFMFEPIFSPVNALNQPI